MDADEKLAKWAALFVRACSEGDAGAVPSGRAEPAASAQYPGVTQAARELLQAVDAGGVPAFVTASLKQIAGENGVAITDAWTPNEIVAAIRSKAGDGNAVGPEEAPTPGAQ